MMGQRKFFLACGTQVVCLNLKLEKLKGLVYWLNWILKYNWLLCTTLKKPEYLSTEVCTSSPPQVVSFTLSLTPRMLAQERQWPIRYYSSTAEWHPRVCWFFRWQQGYSWPAGHNNYNSQALFGTSASPFQPEIQGTALVKCTLRLFHAKTLKRELFVDFSG